MRNAPLDFDTPMKKASRDTRVSGRLNSGLGEVPAARIRLRAGSLLAGAAGFLGITKNADIGALGEVRGPFGVTALHARFLARVQDAAGGLAHLSVSLSEGSFGLGHEGAERLRFPDSEIGHDLAVNFNTGLGQAIDKAGICELFVMDSYGGVDALDPEGAELALFDLSANVGVLAGFPDGGDGVGESILAAVAETLCLLQDFLMAGVGGYFGA